MFKVAVYVTPKQGIADPQGATIERALPALGFEDVGNVRVGRFITLEVDGVDEEAARKDVDAMCRRLLANPIIEDFRFELVSRGGGEEVVLPSGSGDVEAMHHASSPHTAVDPYASRPEEIE